jgi:hypothetical protein
VVTFDHHGRHYNPSRVDPQCVTHMVGPNAPSDGKIFLATTDKPSDLGVALSVIMVYDSYLHKTKGWMNGKVCKALTGKLLSQEYTLWESLWGMGLKRFELKGPVKGGCVTFNCRPLSKSENFPCDAFTYISFYVQTQRLAPRNPR